MRFVKILSTVAAIGSFAVIVLGKIVNITGASKSIPDWPLAFGKLVPEMTPLVFWEWTHRLAVLIVFVTTIALVACAIRVSGKLGLYCALSLVMLLVPALIGGYSILHPSMHWAWAVVDFAFAILYFASMIGLVVWTRMVEGTPVPR